MALTILKNVERDIQEAAKVMKALPAVRVQGYFSSWTAFIASEVAIPDCLEDLHWNWEPKFVPSPAEITKMEEVIFVWLKPLEPEEKSLLWKRASGMGWKRICRLHGNISRSSAWRIYELALMKVARGLEKRY